MKRFKRIMPLFKNFFVMFIDDMCDALIGFIFGAAIDAIINLEIMKAIIFIIVYFIISVVTKEIKEKQINKQGKTINNRGINRKKIICIIGGIIIIYIVLHIDIRVMMLTMAYILLKWLFKRKENLQDKNYKLLKLNLINKFLNKSKSLNS